MTRNEALLKLRKVSLDLIRLADIIDEVKPHEVETFGGDEHECDVIAENIRMCAGHAQAVHNTIDRVF